MRDNDSSLKQTGAVDASLKDVCGLVGKIWQESVEVCSVVGGVCLEGIPKVLGKVDLNIAVINRDKLGFDGLVEVMLSKIQEMCK